MPRDDEADKKKDAKKTDKKKKADESNELDMNELDEASGGGGIGSGQGGFTKPGDSHHHEP